MTRAPQALQAAGGTAAQGIGLADPARRAHLAMRLAPGLTSLVYPALVWLVSSVSAFALPLTLIPLLASVVCIVRIGPSNRHPGAATVALLGVTAPALYSFMGGWLDGHKFLPLFLLPFRADWLWALLWSMLIVLVAIERPRATAVPRKAKSSALAVAHGVSAAALTAFAIFHIGNHLTGLAGADAHIGVMDALRMVYRHPFVEPLLLCAVLFQVLSGIALLRRRVLTKNSFELAQTAAGAYLAVFFASHISAVMRARYLRDVDTNWIWLTSSNLLTEPWSARLVPYYFLAIVALGVHGACGLRSVLRKHDRARVATIAFTMVAAGSVIVSLAVMIGLIRASLR